MLAVKKTLASYLSSCLCDTFGLQVPNLTFSEISAKQGENSSQIIQQHTQEGASHKHNTRAVFKIAYIITRHNALFTILSEASSDLRILFQCSGNQAENAVF